MTHDLKSPMPMLGGLSAELFMRHYWQKRPLLVRQAFPGIKPPLSNADLKRLARQDDVESRLIWRDQGQWKMKSGPISKLPSRQQRDWTLLVQSIDLHSDAASQLMHQFNFIPSARLDDLMASIATEGGGVGPHFDSYDVFLIQAQGTRRWKFSQQKELGLVPDLPLKILAHFEPQDDVVLEPGDMLYLPPHAAHDGIALSSDCMTLSVGFRAPQAGALAQGMLEAAAEQIAARNGAGYGLFADPPLPGPKLDQHYKDPSQPATDQDGKMPELLIKATLDAVQKIKFDRALATRYLGCWLTEPHPMAMFDSPETAETLVQTVFDTQGAGQWRLDRRTRMLFDGTSVYINGELVPIKSNRFLEVLANHRVLTIAPDDRPKIPMACLSQMAQWIEDGWVHYEPSANPRQA